MIATFIEIKIYRQDYYIMKALKSFNQWVHLKCSMQMDPFGFVEKDDAVITRIGRVREHPRELFGPRGQDNAMGLKNETKC